MKLLEPRELFPVGATVTLSKKGRDEFGDRGKGTVEKVGWKYINVEFSTSYLPCYPEELTLLDTKPKTIEWV